MDQIELALEIEPQSTCQQIEDFLKRKLEELGKEGILIGISGGLDSAVAAYLSVRAIGREKISLLNLPDRDSKLIHRQHAQIVADELGIPLEVTEISPILAQAGVYELLPISPLPGRVVREAAASLGKRLLGLGSGPAILEARFRPGSGSLTAKANAYAMSKHRLRMVLLYQKAEIFNLMVVGAANRTEYLTGTFTLWGCDHCADVMPLVHLYRSQLVPLAMYLKLPGKIIGKAAEPDIIPGLGSKEALLGPFERVDRILVGLEAGLGKDELTQRFGLKDLEKIMRLVKSSRSMRESPYKIWRGQLKHSDDPVQT